MCKSFTNCGKNGQNKKQISYINISDQGKTAVKKRCKKCGYLPRIDLDKESFPGLKDPIVIPHCPFMI
jgi:hypothetical protein